MTEVEAFIISYTEKAPHLSSEHNTAFNFYCWAFPLVIRPNNKITQCCAVPDNIAFTEKCSYCFYLSRMYAVMNLSCHLVFQYVLIKLKMQHYNVLIARAWEVCLRNGKKYFYYIYCNTIQFTFDWRIKYVNMLFLFVYILLLSWLTCASHASWFKCT